MNNQARTPDNMGSRMMQVELYAILDRLHAHEGDGHDDEVVYVHCDICSKQLLTGRSFLTLMLLKPESCPG